MYCRCWNCNFNPRPLAGATRGRRRALLVRRISIHAPLRGRLPGVLSYRCPKDFNPRPLAGATAAYDMTFQELIFQSTPPCGGDRFTYSTLPWAQSFQSTPPCGGDPAGAAVYDCYANFNPRPLAGATHVPLLSIRQTHYFNPRPLAGATDAAFRRAMRK